MNQIKKNICVPDSHVQWYSGSTMETNVTRTKKKPKGDKPMPRGRLDKGTKATAEVSQTLYTYIYIHKIIIIIMMLRMVIYSVTPSSTLSRDRQTDTMQYDGYYYAYKQGATRSNRISHRP